MGVRVFQLQLQSVGSNIPPVPVIMLANQPLDRRTIKSGVTSSVVIALTQDQLSSWDPDIVAWVLERSGDGGQTWSVVAALITDSPFYTDRPGAGTFRYRAKTRTTLGVLSLTGNEIEVIVGNYTSFEEGAINEVNASTGAILQRMDKSVAALNGLGEPCLGTGACEGSLGGSYGSGAWYVGTRETTPPITTGEIPSCGATGVVNPLTSITYTIRDLPYPTGGAGINASTIRIQLVATSQNSGFPRLVWDGSSDPWNPSVAVSIVPGTDPLLERDVTLTLASGYISPNDVVTVTTYVEDLDGNAATLTCSFTMDDLDTIPPEVDQQDPECGLGTTSTDLRRAPRNTTYSFRVTDNDSLVDLATLQVYHGPSTTGPWTQVLMNGATFLASFFGNVTPLTGVDNGYSVIINRPVASPLWGADTLVCFRITVDDNQGNSTEDICCWQTEDAARIRNVVVLSERLLFVEFTIPMQRGENPLRIKSNYTIAEIENGNEVRLMAVEPQRFFIEEQVVGDNPTLVEGDGDPRYVVLRTLVQTHWERYRLTVDNLLDYHGLPMASDGKTGEFVARKTKFDAGLDGVDNLGAGVDENLTRQVMIALLFGQEVVGGTYVFDDWEKGS